MGPPQKRRKVGNGDAGENGLKMQESRAFPNPPIQAPTEEDKQKWQGFCEIESEPAFFNVMLREFGVEGVKVQEVLGLDEQLLALLPQPVYGLIFLFRFTSDHDHEQEASCPEHIWFANQTSDYACATVAMLNIVNNVPGLSMGEPLQRFKDFTMPFTPALRGDQLGNFEFVKRIHNSFARKMDMLNVDLAMQNAFADRKPKRTSTPSKGAKNGTTPTKSSKAKSAKAKRVQISDEDHEDNSAFHFVAYLPIQGEVWMLDGLDRQPAKLSAHSPDDWLSVVTPVLEMRMAEYSEGQIEFGLLSLVKDPIIGYRAELAQSIKCLQAIDARLGDDTRADMAPAPALAAETASFNPGPAACDALTRPSDAYNITQGAVDEQEVPEQLQKSLEASDAAGLLRWRRSLVEAQGRLRAQVREEDESCRADERQAADRRHDHGDLIYTWLGMLADNDVLKDLIGKYRY